MGSTYIYIIREFLVFLLVGCAHYYFIRSQKKQPQLVVDGYIYGKKITHANGLTTWRCCDARNIKCTAVCLTKDKMLVIRKRKHNHDPHWDRLSNRLKLDISVSEEYQPN